MGRVIVTGRRTTIVEALGTLLPEGEVLVGVGRGADDDVELDLASFDVTAVRERFPTDAERYVLAAGRLTPARLGDQSAAQIEQSLAVNCISTVQICEHVLTTNPRARIVVLGSESGEKGSFDTSYFLAKAALHSYVRERRLHHPTQQLVAVAPSTIGDSGMTRRRSDQDNVDRILASLPKRRFLEAIEVARLIAFLLFTDAGYVSNEVINVNGGKFARMG